MQKFNPCAYIKLNPQLESSGTDPDEIYEHFLHRISSYSSNLDFSTQSERDGGKRQIAEMNGHVIKKQKFFKGCRSKE
jgi:hypothetical protein